MDADVIIISYSVCSPDSLDNVLERWLPEVRHFCPRRPIILAGNKTDLRPSAGDDVKMTSPGDDVKVTTGNPRPAYVSRVRGEKVAEEIGALRLIECSAKTGHGVREVFLAAASAAVSVQRHRRRHKRDNCAVL